MAKQQKTRKTVTFNGEKITLARPSSPAMRMDIALLADQRPAAFAGALIGAAWRGGGRPKVNLGRSLAEFGAAVYDELVGRGWAEEDIFTLAGKAAELFTDPTSPTGEEVDDLVGFTDDPPPPDGSE